MHCKVKNSIKIRYKTVRLIVTALLLFAFHTASADIPAVVDTIIACDSVTTKFSDNKTAIVARMFDFSKAVNGSGQEQMSDIYVKWLIHTEKRNSIMKLIPTLYVISKEYPDYIREYYGTVWFNENTAKDAVSRALKSTIPVKDKTLPPVLEMYTPDLYSKTLFRNSVLSPFNRTNRKYYRYKITEKNDSTTHIIFKPRVRNTQFVRGEAVTDRATGRILSTNFVGEYDMFKFNISMTMNDTIPILPKKSRLGVYFNFMGNKLHASISCLFSKPRDFPDDTELKYSLDSLRPYPLLPEEEAIYERYDSVQLAKKNNPKDKLETKVYKKAWNTAQQALMNSFRADLGPEDNISLKFSPLLNPSYLNYSHNKGVSYRYDILGKYSFTDNSDIHTKIRLGYMFTKHHFYFDAPFTYTFDAARNGTLSFTVGSGNRITNSSVRDMLIKMNPDSVRFKDMDLKYYNDNYFKLSATYDITNWFSAEVSATYHRRSPVHKEEFEEVGQPTVYKTFAPSFELTFKPIKNGPVLTFDYERGIKGVMKSGIEYEKLEGDLSWVKNFSKVSSLSMRFGAGVYTDKSRDIYFLDYTNFRENNLPGGWNDDWSGEFQLLNPGWYNVSKFYYRSNMTYEQPMIISYIIPFFNRIIETERIYVNFLLTDRIHPYIEYGYAFKNRFFSLGTYLSTREFKYESVGFRFSFEIFSRWR
jgi:hypothetical protein